MQTGVEKRQVFDLPERLIEVTEHQASIYCCAACGFETKAEFPAGLAAPAQYGGRIRAAAIYLNVQQLIPEDWVAQTMNDLFGAPYLCPASLAAWVDGKAAALAEVAAHIGVLARQAPVRHLDETGFQTVVAGMLCDDTPILADDECDRRRHGPRLDDQLRWRLRSMCCCRTAQAAVEGWSVPAEASPGKKRQSTLRLAQLAQNRGVRRRYINGLDKKSALHFW